MDESKDTSGAKGVTARQPFRLFEEVTPSNFDAVEFETSMAAHLLDCTDDVCKVDDIRSLHRKRENDEIKIATISRQFSQLVNPTKISEEKKLASTMEWDEHGDVAASMVPMSLADDEVRYDQATWWEERLGDLSAAKKLGADITCFGEFDYPPPVSTGQADLDTDRHYRDILYRRLCEVKDRPVVTIMGTHHQGVGSEERHNICKIFTNQLARIDDTSSDPITLRKRMSAKTMGEILTPLPNTNLRTYNTTFGRIAILICIDVYAPSVWLSISRYNAMNPNSPIEYVFVPSYNRSPKLLAHCQSLSYIANTVVIYVNSLKRASHPAQEIFFAGFTLSKWADYKKGDSDCPIVENTDNERLKIWTIRKSFLAEIRQDPKFSVSQGLKSITNITRGLG